MSRTTGPPHPVTICGALVLIAYGCARLGRWLGGVR